MNKYYQFLFMIFLFLFLMDMSFASKPTLSADDGFIDEEITAIGNTKTDDFWSVRFYDGTGDEPVCTCEGDSCTSGTDLGSCDWEESDGEYVLTWTGSYSTPEDYNLVFKRYPMGDGTTATQTITITKRPPSIEEEPTFEDGTLEWDFSIGQYTSEDDDVTIRFYKDGDNDDPSCEINFFDDDDGDRSAVQVIEDLYIYYEITGSGSSDCTLDDEDDTITLSYTGYQGGEAGEYSPKLQITYDDAIETGDKDESKTENNMQIGPKIKDISFEDPITVEKTDLNIDVTSEAELQKYAEYDFYEITDASINFGDGVSNVDETFTIQSPRDSGNYDFEIRITDENAITATYTIENVEVEEEPEEPRVTEFNINYDEPLHDRKDITADFKVDMHDYRMGSDDISIYLQFDDRQICVWSVGMSSDDCNGLEWVDSDETSLRGSRTFSESPGTFTPKVRVLMSGEEIDSYTKDDLTIEQYSAPSIENVIITYEQEEFNDKEINDNQIYEGANFRIHFDVEEGIEEISRNEIDLSGSSAKIISPEDDTCQRDFCSGKFSTDAGEHTYTIEINDEYEEVTQNVEVEVISVEPPEIENIGPNIYMPNNDVTLEIDAQKGTLNINQIEVTRGDEELASQTFSNQDDVYEIGIGSFEDGDIELEVTVTDVFGISTTKEHNLYQSDAECTDNQEQMQAMEEDDRKELCQILAPSSEIDRCVELIEDGEIYKGAEEQCTNTIDRDCDGSRFGSRGELACISENPSGTCEDNLGSSLMCIGEFQTEGEDDFWEDCECEPSLEITSPDPSGSYTREDAPTIQIDSNLRVSGNSPINYRLNDGSLRQYNNPFIARYGLPGEDIIRVEAQVQQQFASVIGDNLYTTVEAEFTGPSEEPSSSEAIEYVNRTDEEDQEFQEKLQRLGADMEGRISQDDVEESVESSLTANYYEGRTEMELSLTSDNVMEGASVILDIPKCAAEIIDDVLFEDESFEILQSNPLVAWHFEDMDRDVNLRYEFAKELDPECIEQMRVMSLVNEIGDSRMDSFINSPLFPILVIPVVASVLIYFSKFATPDGSKAKVSDDVIEELHKVIEKRKADGQTEDEIVSDLTNEGFDKDDVEEALK